MGLASIFLRRQALGPVSDSAWAGRALAGIGAILITLIGALLPGGALIDLGAWEFSV